MNERRYFTPVAGLPPQQSLLTDRAVVTDAYTFIPRGVLRDIVTSRFGHWRGTRAWVMSRPGRGETSVAPATAYKCVPDERADSGAEIFHPVGYPHIRTHSDASTMPCRMTPA